MRYHLLTIAKFIDGSKKEVNTAGYGFAISHPGRHPDWGWGQLGRCEVFDAEIHGALAGRVAVVERLVTEPVGERVDAESSLLNKADTENTGINEAATPVIPAKAANKGEQDGSESDDTLEEVGAGARRSKNRVRKLLP